MRTFWTLLALILGAASADAQILAQNLQTPQGTLFTESFGDTGTQPCGYGAPWNVGLFAYSGCNAIWGAQTIGSGGSISIVPSPGTTNYPQGPHSLKVVTGTGNTYLATVGFTPQMSTPFDAQFSLYVSSTSLAAFGFEPIYAFISSGLGSFPCRVDFHTTTAGSISIRGEGSNTSSDISLSLNKDHTVFLHCVPGAASYVTLDGGAQQSFTATTTAWLYQYIGNNTGSVNSITYYIGNIKVNANVQSAGNGPTQYTNFESGTSGSQLSTAILAASTFGGDGGWSCADGAYETVSTAAQLGLLNPVTVLGAQHTDSGSSLGVAFAYSGATAGECTYNFRTYSPVASTFEWAETTLPATDPTSYVSMDVFANGNGSDFVSHMQHNGKLYIETHANPNGNPDVGSFMSFAPKTKYGIATQYQEYSAGSVPGGVYLVQGSLGTGTFTVGETVTQATTGAAATLLAAVPKATAMKIRMVSGTASATAGWTGSSSGATFTPTSLPTTFHTEIIYDQNCNVLSTQLKIANSSSPAVANGYLVGRGGDTNASGINTFWYMDNLFLDYASGGMIPCH